SPGRGRSDRGRHCSGARSGADGGLQAAGWKDEHVGLRQIYSADRARRAPSEFDYHRGPRSDRTAWGEGRWGARNGPDDSCDHECNLRCGWSAYYRPSGDARESFDGDPRQGAPRRHTGTWLSSIRLREVRHKIRRKNQVEDPMKYWTRFARAFAVLALIGA